MAASTSTERIALGLTALVTAGALLASVASADAPPRAGAPAPAFSLPVVANGHGTVSLASLKGRNVYLNFFASWCEPCKAEAPSIAALSKQYAPHNVVVVGIDELEQAEAAKNFATRYHLPYSIALDTSGDVGGSYGLLGLPLHVFISPDGTVAAYRVGEMSPAQIKTELQTLSASHH
ncbi:MAG: TlpA family protein disulfide reductase [Candidatus Eremiobacteraeota bacterium]|nr:TlpA family protein disulfide reductase [Candidatus Eremiobacteraeota bacterium]MBV8204146.1 TlpA family protein disulfide reductase [Candidatus Eremiobacteraeota bacterium]MBV8263225.1 TlpA family protein disulfide reductase [Candidatus Eremiobacteraeota bacterium]MBV8460596.1 TlpA family protein disulfide reductase [Candidatus Eremiobacteraeota bacterium]MBV8594714.1 TlpA family protein disulfide reductase [Candidatus Eremiobacteraeota bacterium]